MIRKIASIVLVGLGLSAAIVAQTTPSPIPSSNLTPVESLMPGQAGATNSPNPLASSAGWLSGNWKVERAIYDLYMSLKDVTGSDEAFYGMINFGDNGKGKLEYNQKASSVDMEYDAKEGSLSIAYGSRLKPQIDLYRVALLNDGSLFLKSQRLANRNGTIHYILRKIQ